MLYQWLNIIDAGTLKQYFMLYLAVEDNCTLYVQFFICFKEQLPPNENSVIVYSPAFEEKGQVSQSTNISEVLQQNSIAGYNIKQHVRLHTACLYVCGSPESSKKLILFYAKIVAHFKANGYIFCIDILCHLKKNHVQVVGTVIMNDFYLYFAIYMFSFSAA